MPSIPNKPSNDNDLMESMIMFLAKPEGGSRIVILRRPIAQPQKHYLGVYA
jgi:hypothetical protein